MTNTRLKLSPPWVTFVNYVKALFENDPEIGITYDNNEVSLKLHVEDEMKAQLLDMLLPHEKKFGNVSLSVYVIPTNSTGKHYDVSNMTFGQIFDKVFDKNPVYSFSYDLVGVLSNVITYVVFFPKICQFFNDNLNDIYGNVTTLYQEVASEVFADAGLNSVMYCTDDENKLNKPLGEWP